MKNFMKIQGNDLIILVQRRNGENHEYTFDKDDFHLLEGKSLYIHNKNGDLAFTQKGNRVYVKDWLLGLPNTKVTYYDGDPKNLRRSNLTSYGIRNQHYIIDDTLVVEIKSKGIVHRALFDADMKDALDLLDCKFSMNDGGYVVTTVDGKILRLHRYVAELSWGKEALEGKVPDHIKGIRHDNRIKELRPITKAENVASRHKTSAKSGFPNVYDNTNGTYQVFYYAGCKYNKTFTDEIEAKKYAYVVRPFTFDQETYVKKRHETVGSIENLKKAISK